jgi:dTDP-D-glucose 4,6-dehydratase
MTVKELIDVLSKIENQDLEVLVRGTDPTDFIYHNDIQSVKKSLMSSDYDGELYEIDEDDIDEDDDEQVIKEVIMLDGGLF